MLVENNAYPQDFRVRREAHTLRDYGCRVWIIAPRATAQPWREEIDGVVVHRFPAPPNGNGVLSYAVEFGYATLAILALAIWIWIQRGIDIIHSANPPDTLFVVGAVFRLLGVRYVFDQHDLAPETYLSRFDQPRKDLVYWALRLLDRASYAASDIVLSTNHSYRDVALGRGKKRHDQAFVVRNGPPLSYQPLPLDPKLRERATYLIGYVGTIGPQDGLSYLVRAVHHLVYSLGRRDFLTIVIGDGDALNETQQLAIDLGVDTYLWFTGRLHESDARRYLSSVDVCVQPDPLSPLNDKSTMNKLMEYMALGKPTVAFDLTETRYSAQQAALYVTPNNVAEFAERTCWLFDNPGARATMGEFGRRRVAESLAWEYSAKELVRAYATGLHVAAAPVSGGEVKAMD